MSLLGLARTIPTSDSILPKTSDVVVFGPDSRKLGIRKDGCRGIGISKDLNLRLTDIFRTGRLLSFFSFPCIFNLFPISSSHYRMVKLGSMSFLAYS